MCPLGVALPTQKGVHAHQQCLLPAADQPLLVRTGNHNPSRHSLQPQPGHKLPPFSCGQVCRAVRLLQEHSELRPGRLLTVRTAVGWHTRTAWGSELGCALLLPFRGYSPCQTRLMIKPLCKFCPLNSPSHLCQGLSRILLISFHLLWRLKLFQGNQVIFLAVMWADCMHRAWVLLYAEHCMRLRRCLLNKAEASSCPCQLTGLWSRSGWAGTAAQKGISVPCNLSAGQP